jgi:hypothetical protein
VVARRDQRAQDLLVELGAVEVEREVAGSS